MSIDLTGTLPTPEEITRFLADPSAGKRSGKIEQLLQAPAYAAYWTTKFCDYTGGTSQQFHGEMLNNRDEIARQWYSWLYKRVTDNMPYDQIVAGIVVANSRSSPDQSYKDYVIEMNSYFRSNNPVDYANHPTLPWFWQRAQLQNTDDKALAFSHAFLGVRLECAQCHKHPFDLWTRNDFKQFSAFFAPIQVGNRPARDSQEISFASVSKEFKESTDAAFAKANPNDVASTKLGTGGGNGNADKSGPTMESAVAREKSEKEKSERARKFMFAEMKQRMETGGLIAWQECYPNFDGMVMDAGSNRRRFADLKTQPKILGADVVVVPRGTDFRQPLMDWLRSKSNPYFAKAIVNRVWASYFSRGIVDPPDDLNIGNAPSNAELMDYLATAFVEHGYDMKWLHREILNSDTYQRSWQTNPTNACDTRNFSHAIIRQLPAEVLADAFEMAVADQDRMNALVGNVEIRAIGPDGTTRGDRGGLARSGGPLDQYFLTQFGKPARAVNCDCERSVEPTLLQTLFTRNDEKLLSRIDDKKSWIGAFRPQEQGRLPRQSWK